MVSFRESLRGVAKGKPRVVARFDFANPCGGWFPEGKACGGKIEDCEAIGGFAPF